MNTLLISVLTVAVIHALAPDHWMPFVVTGRDRKWSLKKLIFITFISGVGHVGSSIVLGTLGLFLGFALTNLTNIESQRGTIAGLLLIGFGLAYAVWGLKQIKHKAHHGEESNHTTTIWTLIAIFVLGPCEPLIPLMFLSIQYGWSVVWLTSIIFGLTTISMMLVQTIIASTGIRIIATEKMEKWSHVLAGLAIALTGILVMVLGI